MNTNAGKKKPTSEAMMSFDWVEGKIKENKTPASFGKIFPLEEQIIIAHELCRRLNTKLHHDGSWKIVLLEVVDSAYDRASALYKTWVPTLIEMQFYDQDGDIQFKVDSPDIGPQKLDIMVEVGIQRYVEDCEKAWQKVYGHVLKALDLREGQTIKAAQGQKSVDPTVTPPTDFVSL